MTFRIFHKTIFFFFFALTAAISPHANGATLTENAKIEALIAHLETLQDATFVRNGSEYDSKSAAKFLRGKWQTHESEVKTAIDFIDKVATKSSTTGKAYVIRIKGTPEAQCADFLKGQLKKLEAGQ